MVTLRSALRRAAVLACLALAIGLAGAPRVCLAQGLAQSLTQGCPPEDLAATTQPAFAEGQNEVSYPPPATMRPDILLVGDSLLHRWPPRLLAASLPRRSAVSVAWSSDTTQATLARLRQPMVAALRPVVAVVLVGTNNLGINRPCAIAAGIAAVVQRLVSQNRPERILVVHLLPRGQDGTEYAAARRAVNARIDAMAGRDGVAVLALDRVFEPGKPDTARLFAPDLLHLEHAGYQMMGSAMATRLR